MNSYVIALFVHIVGTLGFFVGLSLEWTSLQQMRRAMTVEQACVWVRLVTGGNRVGMAGMLLLLVSGFFMMVTTWGRVGWIIVSLGTIVVLVVVAVALSRRRMAAIERAMAAGEGSLSPLLRHLLHHPLLWIAIQTRVALALGIVFLMTVKPDFRGALFTIGSAAVLGLFATLPLLGRERAREDAVA